MANEYDKIKKEIEKIRSGIETEVSTVERHLNENKAKRTVIVAKMDKLSAGEDLKAFQNANRELVDIDAAIKFYSDKLTALKEVNPYDVEKYRKDIKAIQSEAERVGVQKAKELLAAASRVAIEYNSVISEGNNILAYITGEELNYLSNDFYRISTLIPILNTTRPYNDSKTV